MNHLFLSQFISESINLFKAFFYLAEDSFPHLSICIAEGFKELGIPVYSNMDYWKISLESEEYLFQYNSDIKHQDCSIVFIDKNWFMLGRPIPNQLLALEREYIVVYLDDLDGPWASLSSSTSSRFNFILRTHCSNRVHCFGNLFPLDDAKYPENLIPWSFGLSNRMIHETTKILEIENRNKTILFNFRVDHKRLIFDKFCQMLDQGQLLIQQGVITANNPLRPLARQVFLPKIEKVLTVDSTVDNFDEPPSSDQYHYLQWLQTGKRHYPQYYKRLRESVASAAFAGWLTPDSTSGKEVVEWWDSWRFWESLAAGCVTFHVDFDKYGIQLPVKPKNWQHYIGVDLDNIQETVDRITDEPEIVEYISKEGQKWAIDHYSPVPTAFRFLEKIGFNFDLILPFKLQKVNLIVFPDWSQSEDIIYLNLSNLLSTLITHPDRQQICILINTLKISDEDANLVFSGIMMNFLAEEEREIDENLNIALTGKMTLLQWMALVSLLQGKIILDNQDSELITTLKVDSLSSVNLKDLEHLRVTQSKTGEWILQ
jgi:hypothetical protein